MREHGREHGREQGTAPATADGSRLPRWSTPTLTIVGGSMFVSGLFVLAATGHAYSLPMYGFILGSAILLGLPLLLVTIVVAGSESLLGRAWANGLSRLGGADRRLRGTSVRAVRYASVLWLANGAAMWLATLLAQL
ncbi:MAG: hypothetical protein WC273_02450 [Dehalococcoidia bacterium]